MDQLNGKLTISGAITGNLGRYGVQGEHYTGPTLVIPSNVDQILATNGLFVDDDITVKAIPQKELLGVVYDKTYKLSATDYATWTPSTSAGVIVASVNATTFEADMATYDYELKWETSFIAAYKSGATMVAQVIYEGADQYQQIRRAPNNLQNIRDLNNNSNVVSTYFQVPFMRYYNTSGTSTYTNAISYGIYPTLVNATFSNSTTETPTVTIKTPSISARCNNSYFAAARAPELDQAKSTIHIVGKLYRKKTPLEIRTMYDAYYERYISEGAL